MMGNIALINPENPKSREEISDLIREITNREQRYGNIVFGCATESHISYGQRLSIYPLANILARIEDQRRNPNSFPRILRYFTIKDLEEIYQSL